MVGVGIALAPAAARAANVALETPAGSMIRSPGEAFDVIQGLLEQRGHTVTIVSGDQIDTLNEIQMFDTIVLTGSGYGEMDFAVFDAVVPDYVEQGGGLVISGWVYYLNGVGVIPGISEVAPFESAMNYLQNGLIDLTPGHEIVEGLADWNNPSYDAYSGALKVGAIELSRNAGTIDAGVWEFGGGRVASLGPLFTAEYSAYFTQSLHDGTLPDATEMFLRAIEWTALEDAPEGCHDGDLDLGEECDDGNYANNDGCVNPCVFASCGDGYTFAGNEDCDDGDADNTDACLVGCVAASCGDGFTHADVEPCDDGDADNTDTCIDTCELAGCGDGHVFAGFEECDDANAVDGDGCSGCQLDTPETTSSGGESSSEGGSSDGGGSEGGPGDTGGSSDDGASNSTTAADGSGEGGPGSEGSGGDSGGSGDSDATEGGGSGTGGSISGGSSPGTSPFDATTDRGCACDAGGDSRLPSAFSMIALLGLVATRRRRDQRPC